MHPIHIRCTQYESLLSAPFRTSHDDHCGESIGGFCPPSPFSFLRRETAYLRTGSSTKKS